MRTSRLITALLMACSVMVSNAQGQDTKQLAKVEGILGGVIGNSVTAPGSACSWPQDQPSTTVPGFAPTAEVNIHILTIELIIREHNGTCAVAYRLELTRPESLTDGSTGTVRVFNRYDLIADEPGPALSALQSTHERFIAELVQAIEEAKSQ